MKKFISLFILTFFFALSVSAQNISSALRQAEARFNSGNESGAIELVTKVLQKYPENKQAKALLDKFNKTILDRQLDADWQVALNTNTFEAYEQFRTNHPSSKYDETASDNMAKRLADRFTPSSSYSDRTRAESYAKKEMTKDYIVYKWKVAKAKKTSYSNSSSSSYSSNSSSTSSGSHSSSSYSSNRNYDSSSNSYGTSNTKYKNGPFVTFGIEGSIEGLKSFSTGWGLSMRIGRFNSLFNSTISVKYQYTGYKKDVLSGGHLYSYANKVNQIVFPIILNWNVVRNDNYSFYLGVGYEFGVVLSNKYNFEYDFDPFNVDDELIHLSVPARSVVLQMGFAGRHWEGKAYCKVHTETTNTVNSESGAVGMAFTYYF